MTGPVESEVPVARPLKRPRRIWPALVMAVVAVVLWALIRSLQIASGHTSLDARSGAAVVGYLLGSALFISGVVWLVLYFAFLRRNGREFGGPSFFLLLVVASLSLAPVGVLESMRADRLAMVSELGGISDRLQASVAAETETFRAKRDAIVGNGIVDPDKLARRGGLADGYRRLERLRALHTEFFAYADRLTTEARDQIGASETNPLYRRRAIADFDRGYIEGRRESAHSVTLINEEMNEIKAQLDVLARTPKAWTVRGDEIVFSRDADLADFRRHAVEIERIEADMAEQHAVALSRQQRDSGVR